MGVYGGKREITINSNKNAWKYGDWYKELVGTKVNAMMYSITEDEYTVEYNGEFKKLPGKDVTFIDLHKFYFTFGSDDAFPFHGGWVEIECADINTAAELFKMYVPQSVRDERYPNRLNYSFSYNEQSFKDTKMPIEGNLGSYCHMKIGYVSYEFTGGKKDGCS